MKFVSKTFLPAVILAALPTAIACAGLTERIDAIVASQTEAKVRFAVQILNPANGSILYSRSASTPMVPASNMKLVTTAAALKYLGPDFLYQTRVGLIGDSLAVVGSGDPMLGDKATAEKLSFDPRWMLKDIAQLLRAADVASITDIIVDSTVFDDERVHPNWSREDLNRWYACEVSGLNYNGNCVEVIAETVGGKVELTLDPQTAYVEIINKSTPALKPPDTVWCAREPDSNVIKVFGSCHKKCQPVRVAINRPPAFFGFLLAEELARTGITVRGKLLEKEVPSDAKFKTVATYRSSLWDVFERCNKDSLGLAAEALLKTIAASRQPTSKGGSWPAGQQLISQYLLSLGIPSDQFVIDDGSGLSEKNLLSVHAISSVLLDLHKNSNWPSYKKSLAVGGLDGTIDKYFNEPKYRGKIFGKTGYIEGVKSFSGVCTTPGGDRIFAIVANKANGNTRQAINDIVKAVIDEPQ
jgi:D-alanyl-D-alanine carboxypeptidase/D-alanyl-D-alanine-endopeptidase (penicillin-binding protein 4)